MTNVKEKLGEYFDSAVLEVLSPFETLSEIRIKRNARLFTVRGDKCEPQNKFVSDAEFDFILGKMCKESFHTYSSGIANGYIPLGDGYRAGVCGKAICEGTTVKTVHPISAVTVRIPHLIRGISGRVTDAVKKGSRNILIYSKPGEGKTTLIRDLALVLCECPFYYKVCIIDQREEIMIADMERSTLLFSYRCYPKDKAMSSAILSMSPDFIILDEVATEADAKAIALCQSAGVGIIATTHSDSYRSLLSRPFIKMLDDINAFDMYIGIKRQKYGYIFETTARKND